MSVEVAPPTTSSASSKSNNKRRAILDDSDDDDDDQEDQKRTVDPANETIKDTEEISTPTKKASVDTKMASPEVMTRKAPKEEDTPKSESTPKDIEAPVKDVGKLVAQANKLIKLAKVDNTDQLETISSPVRYEDLVTVFEKIESISGRLEIQGIMTTLFRRILRDAPKDLYHAVYLASNSIAPAYECLELGIGDSILQKAIGEAYGTKGCRYR